MPDKNVKNDNKKGTIGKRHNKEEDVIADEHIGKFDKLIDDLNNVRKTIIGLHKEERKILKKLQNAHKSDIKRVKTRKRKATSNPTGFVASKKIGGRFADWLGVERDCMMPGPEISKAFWKKMRELGLQSPTDKRIFRTNKQTTELFGVSEDVNKSDDPDDENGFNMRTYQTYIKYAMTHYNE